MSKRPLVFFGSLLFAVCCAALSRAQEAPLEGHSGHGEVFNEGPRQAARTIAGCGDVHFPVRTESERCQALFDQGVGQLHGFWYFEAERSFRQVAALEPQLAMAYWGMAMANVDNAARAEGFAAEAWRRRENASRREQLYIDALARFYGVDRPQKKRAPRQVASARAALAKPMLDRAARPASARPAADRAAPPRESKPAPARKKPNERARRQRFIQDMEALIYEFPDDIEAKAFLANQLWLNTRFGMPIVSKQANDALLQQVFAKQPNHPAHHYRIHLWDKKDTVERVVDSALASGPAAPGIAHMWHMAGHTFDKLRRFSDAARMQEASARVDHAYMMRERVMPFRIHNYAHNQEWCVRSLLAVGRVREALALAKNLIELPRHPEKNNPEKPGQATSYGRKRLIQVLETAELWDEALQLADTMYLEAEGLPADRAARSALLARACLEKARLDDAEAHIATLRTCIAGERARRAESVDAAEDEAIAAEKSEREVEAAITSAIKKHKNTLRELRASLRELEARSALAKDRDVEALRGFAESARGRPGLASLWLAAGQAEDAVAAARAVTKRREGHVFPQAKLVHALWSSGAREQARKEFEKLRARSAEIELEHAPFARLAPVAASLELPRDWRVPDPATEAPLAESHPEIATLGPFHWAPQAARPWSLPYADKGERSLASYRGKPVLVVFFLGFGCVHCVEQLQALAPRAADFAKAGIEIVTIGTDRKDEVAGSLAAPGEGYSFPILSDPAGGVFKAYRCWDDFEDMPLHGTFLVDAEGLVRWQDIGYEPFMDTEFLLRESKRLLGLARKGDAQSGR